jgi:hypothetical protein
MKKKEKKMNQIEIRTNEIKGRKMKKKGIIIELN